MERTSPHPELGLHVVTFFQRGQFEKGRKSNLTEEKPDKHYLGQVIRDTCRYNNAVPKQVKFRRDWFYF